MKKLIILIATVLMCVSAYAQCGGGCVWFGPKVGANMGIVNMKNEKMTMSPGMEAGVFINYSPATWFSLQVEALYKMRNEKLKATSYTPEYIDRFQSVHIPIIVKFYPVAGLNIQTGGDIGFLLGASRKVAAGESKSNKDSYKSYDLGIPMGLGYDFPFGLTVDVRYVEGLLNINKNKDYGTRRHRSASLSIGWRF